jgi:hypothetical protein
VNHDQEHLRLLSIFHYIVGGLCTLFSFFPLLYVMMGSLFIYAARHSSPSPKQDIPSEIMGWFIIGFGLIFFLIGLALAVSIIMAGRALARRRRYWLAFVVACIQCLFMPFGTVLGVFTIIVLSRESTKQLFEPSPVQI